jgi:hypothetical protein
VRDDSPAIYLSVSHDHGVTWDAEDTIYSTAHLIVGTGICLSKSTLYVAIAEEQAYPNQIYKELHCTDWDSTVSFNVAFSLTQSDFVPPSGGTSQHFSNIGSTINWEGDDDRLFCLRVLASPYLPCNQKLWEIEKDGTVNLIQEFVNASYLADPGYDTITQAERPTRGYAFWW